MSQGRKRIDLLIIDPQVDFTTKAGTVFDLEKGTQHFLDPTSGARPDSIPDLGEGYLWLPQGGSLYVDGAEQDMVRLADFIRTNKHRLNRIHVTMDSHQTVHVAHPIFWVDRDGNPPPVFTVITDEDVEKGVWRAAKGPAPAPWADPANPQRRLSYDEFALHYTRALKQNGRYPLMVWPPHCRVGSLGTQIHPVLYRALMEWEQMFKRVDFVTKGNHPLTEHYSAVMADVQDPRDPTTQLNTRLIGALEQADIVLISGEASTHCVANTVIDIADNFSDQGAVQKFVYLADTCSPVSIVAHLEKEFVDKMTKRGMRVSSTAEMFA